MLETFFGIILEHICRHVISSSVVFFRQPAQKHLKPTFTQEEGLLAVFILIRHWFLSESAEFSRLRLQPFHPKSLSGDFHSQSPGFKSWPGDRVSSGFWFLFVSCGPVVSNPRPARLYYAASGHICEFYVYTYLSIISYIQYESYTTL
jgi:hypothetical protein